MLGNIDIKRLEESKKQFDFIKNTKLAFVAHKHQKDKYNLLDLLGHFFSEADESMNVTPEFFTVGELVRELADVSNMVDLIYDYIINLRAR